jgi:hypothetical protein
LKASSRSKPVLFIMGIPFLIAASFMLAINIINHTALISCLFFWGNLVDPWV